MEILPPKVITKRNIHVLLENDGVFNQEGDFRGRMASEFQISDFYLRGLTRYDSVYYFHLLFNSGD